jgi:hypothetical protein
MKTQWGHQVAKGKESKIGKYMIVNEKAPPPKKKRNPEKESVATHSPDREDEAQGEQT